MSDKIISKRFPANTSMKETTFLNNKKVNGELYAYFQSISEVEKVGENEYVTFVQKKNLPTQTIICEKLGIGTPKTYRNHLKYLIENEFIIDNVEKGRYELPPQEDIYFLIPLKTLQFLRDTVKESVIKAYIYLGQRFKYALTQGRQYEFTCIELGEHIGIKVANNARGYETINNILNALANNELIEYCSYFDGKTMKKKLTNFSFEFKQAE